VRQKGVIKGRFSSEFVGANACVAARGNRVERGKDIFGQTNGRPFRFFVVGDEQKFFSFRKYYNNLPNAE
jgi:hypothetical protein